jgi:sugar diacid utilization regulator
MDHVEWIDAVVDEEGMRAAVGVPVEFQGRLLAVLFVGRRSTRGFSPHQVTLLSSLGNSAAIAINNAQTHGRLAQAMSLHTDLIEPALAGGGPRGISDVLARVTGGRVLCFDWRSEVVASASGSDPLARPAAADLARASARPRETHTLVLSDGAVCRARAIVLGDEVEGHVLVESTAGNVELAAVACEQAATVFALEFAKIRSAEQVETAYHGDLFDELTGAADLDQESVARRATRLGCDLEAPHVVVVVRPLSPSAERRPSPAWRRVVQVATSIARERFGDALVAGKPQEFDAAVACSDPATARAAFGELVSICRALGLPPLRVGVSGVTTGLADYALRRSEAELACDHGLAWRADGEPVCFDELGFHHLTIGAKPRSELVAIARRTIAPLTGYDEAQRGSLVVTLDTYLSSSCNAEATARHLGVHANTLRARLDKISQLLGCDLGAANARLDLHLAMTTLQLAATP